MRHNSSRWLFPILLGLFFGGDLAFTQEVPKGYQGKVLDAQEKPVAGAAAICMVPPGDPLSADAAGVVHLVEPCQRLYCEGPNSLPGEVYLAVDSTLTCRIKPAVLVRGKLTEGLPSGTGERYAELIQAGKRTVYDWIHDWDLDNPPGFSFTPHPPGRFRLAIADLHNKWACSADLGHLAPQELLITVPYRDPKTVSGKVLDCDKQPVAGLSIQAVSGIPVSDSSPLNVTPSERFTWRCGFDPAPWVTTGPDGQFSIAIDPGLPFFLLAGNLDTPQGFAVAAFDTVPTEEITLRLTHASWIRGPWIYKDRAAPASCEGPLRIHDGGGSWLADGVKVPITPFCGAECEILRLGGDESSERTAAAR